MEEIAARFLTDDEKDRIRKTVKEAEKTTSGEIVPMIVSYSYTYPLSNFIGGFTCGLLIAIAAVLILKNENIWLFLAIFIFALIIIHRIIEYIPPLKRLFISGKEIDEEVQEAAITAFYKNGLYKTRDEAGILIFISVFEKKVWILADKGINSKVDPEVWQEIVDIIVDGIKKKKQGEAIIKAVKKAGEILSANFPVKKDDSDELSNLIIED